MRIHIIGERPIIDLVQVELVKDGAIDNNASSSVTDDSEQRFGLIEAAAVVAIVANSAKLIEYLIVVSRALRAGQTATVQLSSGIGATSVELSNQTAREDLAKKMEDLGQP